MNYYLVLTFFSVVLHAASGSTPPVSASGAPPVEERAAALGAVILDKIDFYEKPALDCLKDISRRCSDRHGMGFSLVLKEVDVEMKTPVTFRATDIPVQQLLQRIARIAGVAIELKKEGCVVSRHP